jgi:hypothetical protein
MTLLETLLAEKLAIYEAALRRIAEGTDNGDSRRIATDALQRTREDIAE